MPIYEYQCNNCNHKIEVLQKISDDPLAQCPSCHQQKLKKLVSAASFRLKGSGWYETDFKTGGKKQLAESDSAADSNTDSDKSKSDTSVAKSEPVKSDTTEKKTAKESKKDINKRENTTGKSGSKAVDV
ncbi:MAG: FmdB family transcriptional regulator [Gammaproteobacteria bacterium]|jgi:putative FmdB family regulatory protein|nr:FmdB family transcriptional regulator [Gammaproteobacteria bacterium]MEC9223107.1 zinc ribbon domain-containing protein [Pseudomonadota bacterium]HAD71796.1 FmdB family transcriptional regulator [Gammaproteobacteria bacterium]|tara:strand:+ start:774 stop:1160 length:387 start_codon:yes stop_codon:yes gene_type:complete